MYVEMYLGESGVCKNWVKKQIRTAIELFICLYHRDFIPMVCIDKFLLSISEFRIKSACLVRLGSVQGSVRCFSGIWPAVRLRKSISHGESRE